MTDIFASAPGKLFLCGEYAVLKDAPAVVMAVDRRATVRIGRGDAEFQTLATPGFSDQEFRFEIRNGNELAWLDEYSDTPELVSAVIAETGFETESPSRVEIDTRAFIDESGSKLGLGSSAAATVALTRALLGDDANVVDVWKEELDALEVALKEYDTRAQGDRPDVSALA